MDGEWFRMNGSGGTASRKRRAHVKIPTLLVVLLRLPKGVCFGVEDVDVELGVGALGPRGQRRGGLLLLRPAVVEEPELVPETQDVQDPDQSKTESALMEDGRWKSPCVPTDRSLGGGGGGRGGNESPSETETEIETGGCALPHVTLKLRCTHNGPGKSGLCEAGQSMDVVRKRVAVEW